MCGVYIFIHSISPHTHTYIFKLNTYIPYIKINKYIHIYTNYYLQLNYYLFILTIDSKV